jgi:hypothetical protein
MALVALHNRPLGDTDEKPHASVNERADDAQVA